MNFIDFTKNGGYRLKQFTFRKIQEAYFQILEAFVIFCNVPNVGNYIISGCKIEGSNITSGYMYIDGDLCKFAQTEGTAETKIKKNVVIQSLGFRNGNNENVFRFVNAQVDEAGAALSTFTRVSPVFDSNYVHTDNNLTAALLEKLNGIESQAEKNVQADWEVVNPSSDAFIKNKPNFLNVLDSGTFIAGDLSSGDDETIPITDVGTSNYLVFITATTGTAGSANASNNVTYVVHSKTATSFKVRQRELTVTTQSLIFDWLIIPNT